MNTLLAQGKLGMGTWFLGDNPAQRADEIAALRCGLEQGVRLIDTAEMYGNGRSERLVGEAIAPFARDGLYLVSKVLPSNANARQLERSLDASLRALQTDYLDAYLYHWRGSTPLQETVDTLNAMVQKGKIRAWGVSNFDVEDMQDLWDTDGGAACITNQVLYHLGSRGIEVALKPLLDAHDVATMAYCPLAQAGSLKQRLLHDAAVQAVAAEMNWTVYQVLLAFVLAQAHTVAIPRTGNLAHMQQLLACRDTPLNLEQLARLNQAFPAPTQRVALDIQ